MTATDGFIAVTAGMNSTAAPLLLGEQQFARGINVSTRGGFLRTRPGFTALAWQLPQGKFQGCEKWSLDSGDRVVMVIAGQVVVVDVTTAAVTTVAGATLSATQPCYFCQAHKYMVIQDGEHQPVVLESLGGVYTVVSSHQVPVGTVMFYIHQRLHVATLSPDRTSFRSGDIMKPTSPASVLNFIEDTYWAEGGATATPAEQGFIYGMSTFRNAATGTGVGPFLVFSRSGITAYDLSIPRETWGSVNSSQVLFSGVGTRSPWAIVPVNDDLLFRATDGLRSVRYTRSWVGGGQGALHNVPSSVEVETWFQGDEAYLRLVSLAFADNWLLTTVSGQNNTYFRGLVAMDVMPAYGLAESSPPVYAGLWTGLRCCQLLSVDLNDAKHMLVVAEGPKVYRLDSMAVTDSGTAIESRVITRSFGFKSPYIAKHLLHVDLWLTNIAVDTQVSVYFRPSGYPRWFPLGVTRNVEAFPDGGAGYRRRLRFSLDNPGDLSDTSNQDLVVTGTEFQLAIEFTGNLMIERCLVSADELMEEPPDPEDVALEATPLSGSVFDDYSYAVEAL